MDISRRQLLRGKVSIEKLTLDDISPIKDNDDESPSEMQQLDIASECLAFNQVSCRSCQDSCESQAITFQLQIGKPALPKIDNEKCNLCRDCIGICPVRAISIVSKAESLNEKSAYEGAQS